MKSVAGLRCRPHTLSGFFHFKEVLHDTEHNHSKSTQGNPGRNIQHENGKHHLPSTQDKQGKWRDVCWPVTADFRRQLNDALIEGYGQAIENLQATLEATKGAAEKPSLTGALKENAGKVKTPPAKSAPAKNEQAR